jgi:hypothetical protein
MILFINIIEKLEEGTNIKNIQRIYLVFYIGRIKNLGI